MASVTSNTSVTVGVGSTSIVPSTNRDSRQYLVLSNDSDETIYLAIDGTAVMNTGIRLPVGAIFVLDNEDNINGAVNGICASGGKNICVFERYLDI